MADKGKKNNGVNGKGSNLPVQRGPVREGKVSDTPAIRESGVPGQASRGGILVKPLQSADPLYNLPPWKLGMWKAVLRFRYIGVVTILWLIVSKYELLNINYIGMGDLILPTVLFILSIPCSVLFRLDRFFEVWALSDRKEVAYLIALLMTFVNFLLVGGAVGFLRGRKKEPS